MSPSTTKRHQAFGRLPRQDRHALARQQAIETATRRARSLLDWTDVEPAPIGEAGIR